MITTQPSVNLDPQIAVAAPSVAGTALQIRCLATVAGWLERFREFEPSASALAFALVKCDDLLALTDGEPVLFDILSDVRAGLQSAQAGNPRHGASASDDGKDGTGEAEALAHGPVMQGLVRCLELSVLRLATVRL